MTPAFDITLSAPRSVGIAWSLASYDTKNLLVVAQQRAVRATLKMLENEAAWARRGQNGAYLEKVGPPASSELASIFLDAGEKAAACGGDGVPTWTPGPTHVWYKAFYPAKSGVWAASSGTRRSWR